MKTSKTASLAYVVPIAMVLLIASCSSADGSSSRGEVGAAIGLGQGIDLLYSDDQNIDGPLTDIDGLFTDRVMNYLELRTPEERAVLYECISKDPALILFQETNNDWNRQSAEAAQNRRQSNGQADSSDTEEGFSFEIKRDLANDVFKFITSCRNFKDMDLRGFQGFSENIVQPNCDAVEFWAKENIIRFSSSEPSNQEAEELSANVLQCTLYEDSSRSIFRVVYPWFEEECFIGSRLQAEIRENNIRYIAEKLYKNSESYMPLTTWSLSREEAVDSIVECLDRGDVIKILKYKTDLKDDPNFKSCVKQRTINIIEENPENIPEDELVPYLELVTRVVPGCL